MNPAQYSADLALDTAVEFHGTDVTMPWLIDIDPSTVHLGQGSPDIDFKATQIYLGNRPVVVDFQRLAIDCLKSRVLQTGGDPANPDEATVDGKLLKQARVLRSYWNYYLVLFGLGISNCDHRLREVGLQLSYIDNAAKPVTILDYWPKSQSRTLFSVGGDAKASIDLEGHMNLTNASLLPILGTIPLPMEAKIDIGGSGNVVAQLSFKMSVPVVESFGCYAQTSRWTFEAGRNEQLLGHLIHTTSKVSSLRIEAKLSAIYGGWFNTRAKEEKTIDLAPAKLRLDD